MATPKPNTPVWPSIDFTDGLVPLKYIEDCPEEDPSKKDGTEEEDCYEATTKTFQGCYNILTEVKPTVWKDCWWSRFKDSIEETAQELELRLMQSNLVINQIAKCHFGYFDGDFGSDNTDEEESPYFNIEFNFDTLETIFREYQVEELNGTPWQKTVALEHAYTQKLLEMEVLETSFETIFTEAITGSFDGSYKKKKIEYYVGMATTKVLIRALAFHTLVSYDDMVTEQEKLKADEEKRKREIAEIDAKAEEHKKRLKKEHEASIKEQMTEFDKQMALMQEQMQKMQQQMQKMQDKKEDIKKSCENDLKEALEEAQNVRDQQVRECIHNHYANVKAIEKDEFPALEEGEARKDGTMNNPQQIGDEPESQLDIEESALPESQPERNSKTAAMERRRAAIEAQKKAEDVVPQVATKQAAQQIRIQEQRELVRASNKAATKQQEEEEAAKLKKKKEAGKRKRNMKDSSGSPPKRQAPQAQQARRRSSRQNKGVPEPAYVPVLNGKIALQDGSRKGLGKPRKGKSAVTSPNVVSDVNVVKLVE